jgi:hypothetical protein
MDPSILRFAQMAGIFVTMCAALAVVMLAFNVATRLVRRVASQAPAPRFDDQRQARLEQAVDAIAIEVERVSESQRFISKLLGERSQESSRLLP